MRGRRPEISALVAALGLHVVTLGVLRLAGSPLAEPRRDATAPVEELFELELRDVPSAPDGSSVVARREEPREARLASAPGAARGPAQLPAPSLPPTTDADLETAEPAVVALAPVTPDAANVAPPAKPIDLGLGPDGWQRFMTAPAPGVAPPAARAPARSGYQVFRPAPASTTGGLQEGLDAKDRARGLGLGPEGRVLSALQKAAHAPVAPESGVARFEVTVHTTGAVEVRLGAASAERERWNAVAGHLANDLRSSPPRIPPPHDGLTYVVEVVAEDTLPNGTKAKSRKKAHLDAPLKFQSTDASIEQTNRENPTIVNPTADDIALKLDTPGVYVAKSNGVCDYRAGAGVIAPGYGLDIAGGAVLQGACDPAQVGAKAQRVVRTRLVAQSVF